jgi:hypothetical protein
MRGAPSLQPFGVPSHMITDDFEPGPAGRALAT